MGMGPPTWKIDWNAMWRQDMDGNQGLRDSVIKDSVKRWDHSAPTWSQSINNGNYSKQMISRMKLQPDWTVLDVGCGAGAMALPLARQVKKVTALDVSSEMLSHLRANASKQGINNIDYVNGLMEELIVGKDIELHNVVLSSRSIGLVQRELRRALAAFNNAANNYIFVTWRASERTFTIGLHKAVGRIHHDSPNYIIIVNLLNEMGIFADVELVPVEFSMMYKSFEDATKEWIWEFKHRGEPLDENEVTKLKEYFNETFVKRKDGMFEVFDRDPAWALISWKRKKTLK
jgi:SAM-dependent methyltransferase